ncbi:hypothetical protein U1Q18_021501, partial [Sarracenia purpurea var. burkii]
MLVGREEVGVAPRQGRCPTVRRGVAVDAPSMMLVPGRSSLLPVLEISLGFIDPPFPRPPPGCEVFLDFFGYDLPLGTASAHPLRLVGRYPLTLLRSPRPLLIL